MKRWEVFGPEVLARALFLGWGDGGEEVLFSKDFDGLPNREVKLRQLG